MADDDDQRTEDPTARRLRRARDEGQFARSNEATGAAVVLGAMAMMAYMGDLWFNQIAKYFASGFSFDRKTLDTPMLLPAVFGSQLVNGLLMILPLMMLTATLAIMASGVTGGYHFSLAALAPKFEKLSLFAGIKRMVGAQAAVELLKSILKFGLVAFVLYLLLDRHFTALMSVGNMELGPAMALSGCPDIGLHALACRELVADCLD